MTPGLNLSAADLSKRLPAGEHIVSPDVFDQSKPAVGAHRLRTSRSRRVIKTVNSRVSRASKWLWRRTASPRVQARRDLPVIGPTSNKINQHTPIKNQGKNKRTGTRIAWRRARLSPDSRKV